MGAVVRLVLGLGGNVGDPQRVFSECLTSLAQDGRILKTSRLWRTRPVGPPQPDFLNAAVLIDWPGSPRSLLRRCRQLEAAAGRNRSTEPHWGPRPLDLDLLLAKDIVCRGPSLELPHPRLHQRRFAVEPAAEVAPDWVHPLTGDTLHERGLKLRASDPNAVVSVDAFRR
jgi:2-amino-4-hydroxy-6-hydroxymethyldihydropteridine diphosphokinase